MISTSALLDRAAAGHMLAPDEALALADCDDLAALMEVAAALRDRGHGARVSYSRKVFIPLTQLCRDSCHYCTFAHPPRRGAAAYLSPEEVLAIARAGAAADCKEALFTLGDKPELRYRAAPAARLATIRAAGEAAVPFTSGILIGIGETRRERIEALLQLRELDRRYGHLQEIIIQNFRAKDGTRMASHAEPSLADHLWTVAI